ncbi:hypothetical protein HGRIS_009544 [Hohenbuehelia grisea]|uniref:VTT domain-containing protein n=1 Tax=Hohenbuehelia grisea TaxID=104357 RepID=A0ABR3J1G8_9AGAR
MPPSDHLSLPPEPPHGRLRASSTSTSLRPLNLASLGRRRSSSNLQLPQSESTASSPALSPVSITPTSTPPSEQEQDPSHSSSSTSMLLLLASRVLDWAHVHPKHSLSWSTPSSPRSSVDEFVLPLSAPPTQTTFGDSIFEKESAQSSSLSSRWFQGLPPLQGPILYVLFLFPISTALVLYSLSTLPISLAWPRTVTDLAQLGRELLAFSQSGLLPMTHVVLVISIVTIWNHAWSIPGGVIWNVLAGALFSPAFATLLLTLLTTLGSLSATLLAAPLAPFLTHFFPKALDMTRQALEGPSPNLDVSAPRTEDKSSAWVRLSVLRLVGVVPWSGINIACGVCGVAISDCVLGAFIGSLPWTAVTCQIGDILQTVASTPSPTPKTVSSLLMTPEIILKLVFLSFLSLAPILGRGKLRAWVSHSDPPASVTGHGNGALTDERVARWAWVQEWRQKIKAASRSRTRERDERMNQLAVLIQEKGDLERFSS